MTNNRNIRYTIYNLRLLLLLLVLLGAVSAEAQLGGPLPVTTPWSRNFLRSPDGGTAAAQLGVTNGPTLATMTNVATASANSVTSGYPWSVLYDPTGAASAVQTYASGASNANANANVVTSNSVPAIA